MIAYSDYKTVVDREGTVEDVVHLIIDRDKYTAGHTKELAEYLEAETDKQTFRNIWKWVKKNIRYIPDAEIERVKSPGATYRDGYADCKSMALMVGSILQNLGIPYYYRVTFYDENNPDYGHIYVVAKPKGGAEVSIDPVHDQFNDEPNWWKKKDYMPNYTRMQAIQGLGDFPQFNPNGGTTAPPTAPGAPQPSAPQQPAMNNKAALYIGIAVALYFIMK